MTVLVEDIKMCPKCGWKNGPDGSSLGLSPGIICVQRRRGVYGKHNDPWRSFYCDCEFGLRLFKDSRENPPKSRGKIFPFAKMDYLPFVKGERCFFQDPWWKDEFSK